MVESSTLTTRSMTPLRITLRQLQVFVAVAEAGSTAAAATVVSLTQSATSASVNELERLLDAALFDRVGRGLVLNDEGRSLQVEARALLDAAYVLEQSHGAQRILTRLQIGASTTIGNYLLPGLIRAFDDALPGNRISARIGNTAQIEAGVLDFSLDVGLIEGPAHDSDVVVLPWRFDELLVVAAPSHDMALRSTNHRLDVVALRGAPWLMREPGSGTREAVEHALLPRLHHLNETLSLGSSEAIKNAVAEGLGIACLSRCIVADMLADGRLVALDTSLPPLRRRFSLIHHRRKTLSYGLRRWIDAAMARVEA